MDAKQRCINLLHAYNWDKEAKQLASKGYLDPGIGKEIGKALVAFAPHFTDYISVNRDLADIQRADNKIHSHNLGVLRSLVPIFTKH